MRAKVTSLAKKKNKGTVKRNSCERLCATMSGRSSKLLHRSAGNAFFDLFFGFHVVANRRARPTLTFGCFVRRIAGLNYRTKKPTDLKLSVSIPVNLRLLEIALGSKILLTFVRALVNCLTTKWRRRRTNYHIADYMNNADDGSLELIIRYDPNL